MTLGLSPDACLLLVRCYGGRKAENMTKIYLIRHAEAEGNLYRRGQGHFDGKVTAQGEKQIAALAERFKEIPITALYSSDLSRTQATAGAVLKYNPELNLCIEPRLREVCMGVWENQAWGNMAYDHPEQMANFSHNPENWTVEGGEPFSELTSRMTGIIGELGERHKGETIAAVSHGMAIRALLCATMKIPPNEISRIPHSDNTAVSLLKIENGEVIAEFYNDNSHLSDDISTFAKQTWWKEKSGNDGMNLRFLPLDLSKESKFYSQSYADTWRIAHGNLKGFEPEYYLERAARHAKSHPMALVKALKGEEIVGIIDLDIEKGRGENAGWISLCFIEEAHRNQRLGVQLIGHAVFVFRNLGRKTLRLSVAESNKQAIGFYEKYGFKIISEKEGAGGVLLVMEMEI